MRNEESRSTNLHSTTMSSQLGLAMWHINRRLLGESQAEYVASYGAMLPSVSD
jgi:hypothetical protein